MARPWKHPKTGVYYFRKRVPADLVGKVGRKIEKETLGTKNEREANKLFTLVAADYEHKWDQLRATPIESVLPEIELTKKQITAYSGQIYDELMDKYGDDPGNVSIWVEKLRLIQPALPPSKRDPGPPLAFGGQPAQTAGRLYGQEVKAFLERKNLNLEMRSRNRLYSAAAVALSYGYKQLIKHAEGDFSKDPNKETFPPLTDVPGQPGGPLPWETVYEAYLLNAGSTPATQKRAKGVLKKLFEFLGYNDLRRVTKQDMVRWRDHNLTLGKAHETVRDADMAHPKALFRFAAEDYEHQLESDPTAGIRVRVPKKQKLREPDFTDEEAYQILSWSLVPCGPRTSVDRAAAIRWVPWICAYHGSRVNEITQLRVVDIHVKKGRDGQSIWMMRISPEAGSVKDNEARDVALHPDLIGQGFLDYVKSCKGERLFYDPSRARSETASNPLSNKVGDFLANWVRNTVGIDDPVIRPNHGWRHLFRSRCRAQKIHPETMDLLDGHQGATEGAKYGSLWPEVSLENISLLPRFSVKPARSGKQVPGAPNGEGSTGPRSRKGEVNYGKRPAGRPLNSERVRADDPATAE